MLELKRRKKLANCINGMCSVHNGVGLGVCYTVERGDQVQFVN